MIGIAKAADTYQDYALVLLNWMRLPDSPKLQVFLDIDFYRRWNGQ